MLLKSLMPALMATAALTPVVALAQGKPLTATEAAQAFGARERVEDISLSPDGTKVTIASPGPGQSSVVQIADVASGQAKPINYVTGDPLGLSWCRFVNDTRIVCSFYGVTNMATRATLAYTRLTAMDTDGQNAIPLGRRSRNIAFQQQSDGTVIDWLDGKGDDVLMSRVYVEDAGSANSIGNTLNGLGVDRIDTRTGKSSRVESVEENTSRFLSDGQGHVRLRFQAGWSRATGLATGRTDITYRTSNDGPWLPFGTYDGVNDVGLYPIAIDPIQNAAYALNKVNGRQALYRVSLDGSLKTELVLDHPRVDIDNVVRVGRNGRVVGATFAEEKREAVFFDPKYKALVALLGRALPKLPLISIVDSSADENVHLVHASSDVDPGRYYVFDAKSRRLDEIALDRPDLEAVALGETKPVTYVAADGTKIPAYLTLPPGSAGKKLPAIVMPHGGPAARDEWGFDWLAQFYVNRGYAVLQPNFRGSSGYGEDWLVKNGFQSWKTAIGDVNDAGRWLVKEGIADPAKLAIVGWSYGGYAALQSGVVDADLYKAVVAIAPVVDFTMWKNESRGFTNMRIMQDYVGTGPHLIEGSPARHAAKLKAPVMLFHGDRDINVAVGQSRYMDQQLKAAGKQSTLIVYPKIDHQLRDSAVRADMLEKSEAFLRTSLKL